MPTLRFSLLCLGLAAGFYAMLRCTTDDTARFGVEQTLRVQAILTALNKKPAADRQQELCTELRQELDDATGAKAVDIDADTGPDTPQ